jgi:uncharacterized protein YjbI with pentapeptide repeats
MFAFTLLFALGLTTLPAAPVAAANCAAIGPGAFLAGCDLSGLDLSGANLSGANLRGADLTGTNLDGANLSGANLSNATLTEGALDTANTSGANLRGIRWVPVPVPRVVTLTFTRDGLGCLVNAQLSGFQPNTTYDTRYVINDFYRPSFDGTVVTDGNGDALITAAFLIGVSNLVELTVDGASSGTVPVGC